MKTVADLVKARRASFCIEVFAGSIPRAILDVNVRGRSRSYGVSAFRAWIVESEQPTSIPMPSWSLPVDCLGPFSFDPCVETPDSVRIEASTGVLLEVGDKGAGSASPAAASDTLLRGGMVVKVQKLVCLEYRSAVPTSKIVLRLEDLI